MRFSRIWRGGFFYIASNRSVKHGARARTEYRAVTRRVSTRGQRGPFRRQHAKLSRVYTCSSPPSPLRPSIGIADRRRRSFALSPSKRHGRFTPGPLTSSLCDPVCRPVCTHVAYFHAHRPLLITFNLASSPVVGGARRLHFSYIYTRVRVRVPKWRAARYDSILFIPPLLEMRNIITLSNAIIWTTKQ